jgi:hypothetical protein
MNVPATDANAAQRFLDLLAPGELVTFQTFDESGKQRRPLSRVMHGSLADNAVTLDDLNAQGAGVFWMVNVGDLKGRKASNVQRVRALFVDLDGAPLLPVRAASLPAHCIVETSPNRWHAYWRVSDCSLSEFTLLQQALAAKFGGDKSVNDLPRVMRLPGFDHCKQERYRAHCVALHDDVPPYAVAQLREAFALDNVVALPAQKGVPRIREELPHRIYKGERNTTLFSLGRGLAQKGIDVAGVNQRLKKLNAERCDPPLCATEVDDIAANASSYGSDGFAMLPHKLLDSPEWKSLAPAAHDVVLTAFRRYNGTNNGNIALTWKGDFDQLPGFGKKEKFYEHRKAAVNAGFLLFASKGRNSQTGRRPDLFAIPPRWIRAISPVRKEEPGASTEKVDPYIDKQKRDAVASSSACAKPKRKKAA